MDLIGTFIIMAAAICYLLALQWGGVTKEWSSGSVVAPLVIFILLVIAFVVAEWWQGDRAVLVGRLLRNRTILIASIYAFFLGGAFFTLLYYIPIYFQAILDVKAGESGVRNLALILATSIFTILSGGLITMTGHFVPFLIGGGVLTTIGAGLIFTLGLASPPSMWIGYQILAGIGIGLSIQVPIIASQAVVEPIDISSITAMILCKFPRSRPSSFPESCTGGQRNIKTHLSNIRCSLPNDWWSFLCLCRSKRVYKLHHHYPGYQRSVCERRQGDCHRRHRDSKCLFCRPDSRSAEFVSERTACRIRLDNYRRRSSYYSRSVQRMENDQGRSSRRGIINVCFASERGGGGGGEEIRRWETC